jgi:hypothetical protein
MKIVGISGRKQSGKNTAANYINGLVLKERSMVEDFKINTDGALEILTTDKNMQKDWGIFDVCRKDKEFTNYAEYELWPYVKVYHFADSLKDMSASLFSLKIENLYGTDKQKNAKTKIQWEDLPTQEKKSGYLTYREFLEYFGTSIVRKIKNDAWVNTTITKIFNENSNLAIIPDVRFPNEVQAIKDNGGIVIRLTRNVCKSTVECESALDKDKFDWSLFDYVIDNENFSITDTCKELDKINHIWKS